MPTCTLGDGASTTKSINLGNDGGCILFVFPRKSTCSSHLESKENLGPQGAAVRGLQEGGAAVWGDVPVHAMAVATAAKGVVSRQ